MGNPKMGLFCTMPTLLKRVHWPLIQSTRHCAQCWIVPTLAKQVPCTLHSTVHLIVLFLHYSITAIDKSTAHCTAQYCFAVCIELVAFAAAAHCPAPLDGLSLSGKVTPDNGETTRAKPTLREKKKKIRDNNKKEGWSVLNQSSPSRTGGWSEAGC